MAYKPYDITGQIRQINLETNLFRENTQLHDTTVKDLKKFQISNFSGIIKFNQTYLILVVKTSKAFK